MAVEKQPHPATTQAAEEDALIGRTIGGRYRIVGTVGLGGMGRVYDAVQSPLDRHVAIKVLLGGHAHDAAFRRRFMLEAAVTSKLTHPNTVTLFDYGEHDGIYYIAMELLKGRTLSDVVRQEGALSQERAIHIAQQVCRSLSEAHSQGVIHRDLKPANVMLLSQRHELDFAKVLDFGLVKFFTDGVDGHTHQGTFVGTPHYVSPEQARDEQPDPRSDVYSLGILIYLMLTGHVPFHAASAVEVLVKQLNEQPVPPRERRPDLNIDPQLEALVLRCLAKQRDERVQSMDELLAALTQVRSHIVTQARSVARGPDPLMGVSPPGLLNPTPPAAGIRARGTPLASISNRIPNSTPRPISNRVPHSIPPTPALVQNAPAVATKRGPAIALGAAVVVAVALVGTALFVRSHRAPVAAPAAAPSRPRLTMEIDLDGRRPAPPVETPPAAAEPAPAVPVQVAPAENKTAPEPQKESAKRRPARPVAPAPKEPEKALAVVPVLGPPAPPAPEPAAKPVEPPPAPVVAAASIAGSTPPPTLPISTRPREVSSALLQTQKINAPSPKIPEWFQRNFARQTMQAVYRICIGTDGRVSEVKVVTELGGGVDADLVKQIKNTWTYRPQLIPLCADSKLTFRL
ncbi:MAG: serine/threonine-protein kinase [Myxococcales bacterium]